MLAKLIPIVIGLTGLGAGIGAGLALRPAAEAATPPTTGEEMAGGNPCGDGIPSHAAAKPAPDPGVETEFVKMSNQFVFPLVENGQVMALVVLSLTLEVAPGQTVGVFAREPKLRDGFLRILLDHANAGGFRGAFTANQSMDNLRRALIEKGRELLGEALYDVLILEINRQDI